MRGWIPCVLALAACGDNIDGNRAPTIEPFDLTTPEDLAITRTIAATDFDAGDQLTATVPIPPDHGTVTISGLSLTYTPAANYHGNDRFALTVSDGVDEASITVNVSVQSIEDQPIGGADSLATNEDTPRTVPAALLLANDSDADGDTLTLTDVKDPVGGTVAFALGMVTFSPDADFKGSGSFLYTITDGTSSTDVTVTVVVGGANDAPVANDDTVATDEDTPVTIPGSTLLANDTDVDGDTLEIQSVANGTGGTVELNGGNPIFTPTLDFTGAATFTYTVFDGVATDTATVTVNVGATNDPPVAVNDTADTDEDTPVTIAVLANDSDPDAGDTLTVINITNEVGGTAVVNIDQTVTFTPTPDFAGPTASFDYEVSDGDDSDIGTVTITIEPVNDPVNAADDTATTNEDTAVTIDVLANDVDVDVATQGQTLAITNVTTVSPANSGTAQIVNNQIVFTPSTNATSDVTATFDYTVSDGEGSTDTATVTVTITPVNDPPVAVTETINLATGAQISIAHALLLGNDSDGGDGGALEITGVDNPVNGTVVLGATTITFTPDEDFAGNASFQYTISDGLASSTTTVILAITAARDCGDGKVEAPELCDDDGNADGDGCSATCTTESGFICTGEPSTCVTTCGDGIVAGLEECDDGPGNTDETDGCTTQCVAGRPCNITEIPLGSTFSVDPATGHCYALVTLPAPFVIAQQLCVSSGGHLATVTSAAENIAMSGVNDGTSLPRLGATSTSTWITQEPFVFDNYASGEPSTAGPCIAIAETTNYEWASEDCVVARPFICEFEADPCGDHILQISEGEECDDGNTISGDTCSATCQVETGCGNGAPDPGEECDDDNLVDGDGCSSTCQDELLVQFTFTGAAGNEPSLAAEVANGIAAPVMSRGAGLSATSGANTFSAASWTTATSIDADDFFTFTITPNPGGTVTLLRLEFDERRSGTGIRQWSVRSSLDGFASDLQTATVPDDDLVRTQTIVLPVAFRGVSVPVELRFFGFEAEAGGGTWRLDNVNVFGGATP